MKRQTERIRAEALKALERIKATLEATGELERDPPRSEREVKATQGGGKARKRRSG